MIYVDIIEAIQYFKCFN